MIAQIALKESKEYATALFKWVDFKCKCKWEDCYITIMSKRTLTSVQSTREEYGEGFYITSAYRCNRHNEMVGGTATSNHKAGDAVDLWVDGSTKLERLASVARRHFKYVSLHKTYIHCDNRMNKGE